MADFEPNPDWARVSDANTGHHYTVTRKKLERSSHLTELKQPALTPNGQIRPATNKIPKGTQPAGQASEATTDKAKEAAK